MSIMSSFLFLSPNEGYSEKETLCYICSFFTQPGTIFHDPEACGETPCVAEYCSGHPSLPKTGGVARTHQAVLLHFECLNGTVVATP